MIRFENSETRELLIEKSNALHLPVVGHLVAFRGLLWEVGDVLWDLSDSGNMDIVILLEPIEFS